MIKQRFNKRLVLSFVALLLWSVMTICITGCSLKTSTTVVQVEMQGQVLGRTTCDTAGNTVILINGSNPGAMETYGYGYVLLHEQTHVNQAKREGSCRKFITKYHADSTYAFQSEAEAYCGELEVRALKGIDRNSLIIGLVNHLKFLFPFYSLTEIAEKLPCNGGTDAQGEHNPGTVSQLLAPPK